MYKKACGIIETLAPLHVGATAGEESGNLNLIFRDQFTQTGIIPGSSIRGRFRAEMRREDRDNQNTIYWYGQDSDSKETSESLIKFEYASIVWIPVFCPGQPIVWVSCPQMLKRYKRIAGDAVKSDKLPKAYTGSSKLEALSVDGEQKLFFNFGFLTIDTPKQNLSNWFPLGEELPAVVVGDDEIAMIHDMALYRQTRVALDPNEKRVKGKAFFNTEALPEGTILAFPIAIRKKDNQAQESKDWKPFGKTNKSEMYFGGLESIGFGRCEVTLKGV